VGCAGGSGSAYFERQHGGGIVVEALGQVLIHPVLGLASGSCPHALNAMAGIAKHVPNVIPVVHAVGEYFPLLERQLLGHFAVLHLPGGVVVADALLGVAVEDDADVVAAVRNDDAGLPVGDDAAPDLGRNVVASANVVAVVVVYGLLHACSAVHDQMRHA